MAARSKTRVFGRSLAGNAGSNPAVGMDVSSPDNVVCGLIQVSVGADHLSSECGVSECDDEAWTTRRPWPTRSLHVIIIIQ